MTQELVDGRLFVFRSMSYFKSDDLVTCNQLRLGFLSSSLSGCRIDGVVGCTCHGWVCGHVRRWVCSHHYSQYTHAVTTNPNQRSRAASGSEDRLIDKPVFVIFADHAKVINGYAEHAEVISCYLLYLVTCNHSEYAS